jgi:dipeptide/tripeptide permease
MSAFAFTADAALGGDLDAEEVPQGLRRAFEQHKLPLSDKATVSVEEAGGRWQLKDAKQTYRIVRTEEGLKVYESNVPVGALNSINPFIICFGVILSTPIVARFKLFNVMLFGITISAVSMLFLAIHPAWFCGLFGWSLAQGYALIVILQIVLFSIGEVIWSPRLYEYTAAIAPKGREASYMGLSYLPMFFARFAEGPLAGFLLTRYCPPDVTDRLTTVSYTQSQQFMCLILALIALASPLLVRALRGVIQKESRLEHLEMDKR